MVSVVHLHLKTATPYRWVHICECVVCHHLTQHQPLSTGGYTPVVCHHLTQQQPLSTGGYTSVMCVVCHHLTQQQLFSTGGYTSVMCAVCHHIKQQQPNFAGGCGSLPVQLSSVQGGSSYMLRKTHTLHPS